MNTFRLEISYESADSLFIDILNDDLDDLLNVQNIIYMHPEDCEYNTKIAEAIETLMSHHLNRQNFSTWKTDIYLPKLEKYIKYYQDNK